MTRVAGILLAAAVALTVTGTQADVILTADPDYVGGAAAFTLDPELYNPSARNVAATRNLRQTFQLAADVEVGQIVTSLVVQDGGGGLVIDIYEVADVNAGSWTPGSLVHTLTIATTTAIPTTTARLGLTLSGADVFSLAARNTGAEGYGFEISNVDGVTNVGAWRHSNDGVDNYTAGLYYDENGNNPNSARDMGIALYAVPEPGTLTLGALGVLLLAVRRRRRG